MPFTTGPVIAVTLFPAKSLDMEHCGIVVSALSLFDLGEMVRCGCSDVAANINDSLFHGKVARCPSSAPKLCHRGILASERCLQAPALNFVMANCARLANLTSFGALSTSVPRSAPLNSFARSSQALRGKFLVKIIRGQLKPSKRSTVGRRMNMAHKPTKVCHESYLIIQCQCIHHKRFNFLKAKVTSAAPHNEVQIQSSETMARSIQMPPLGLDRSHTARKTVKRLKNLHSGKTETACRIKIDPAHKL